VVIGSAGSGKTAVTLARLREAEGRVLYVTLSAYLAQSARALHAAHGFENPKQEVEFLSYRELLETLRVPNGREVTLPAFAGWCSRHRQTLRQLGAGASELDAQALFEEFRGVIGAQPGGPLSLADYLALGTRQSLLSPAQRELAHGLFQRYCSWLEEAKLYDSNLIAEAWRSEIAAPAGPIYDFIVIPPNMDGMIDSSAFNMERNLFKRELIRICEFCETAENGPEALASLLDLRRQYNLLSL
jgi:hypothetical protein